MAKFSSLVRDLRVVGVSVFVTTALAAGPAMAAYDALNSDAVDGKDAVSAGAKIAKRAGKLVATDSHGYLPNNIVRRVGNSFRLQGRGRSAFVQHQTDPGELQTGLWAVSGAPGDYGASAVSLPERLKGSIGLSNTEVLQSGDTSAACPGPGQVTSPGHMCLYVTDKSNASMFFVTDPDTGDVGVAPSGFVLLTTFTDNGYAYGTYAVRSPK